MMEEMKVEFCFVPQKLMKANQVIKQKHSRVSEPKNLRPNPELHKLIVYLSQLDATKVEQEALALTNKEMEDIAGYIPYNFYRVSLKNLFHIFQIRSNERLCLILFHAWQNAFDQSGCNFFMETLLLEDKNFKEIILKTHFTEQKFSWILKQKNIPLEYGKEAQRLKRPELVGLKEKLTYFGIKSTSNLAIQCEFLWYVFCKKEDYLLIKEYELLKIIQKYDEKIKKVFLLNFLSELSLEELKKFSSLAEYFSGITGENRSKEFNLYFADFEQRYVRKFVDWINICKINKIFGKDERSVFWEKYHYEDVKKYSYSNSIIMEFENYVAIEFLGQANGPAYIYKKDYFDKNLRNAFVLRLYDNKALRQYLYKNTQYEDGARRLRNAIGTRLKHLPNPGWSSIFADVLINNNITERIW